MIIIGDAAAPQSSLAFMFWGEGLFLFPLMLGRINRAARTSTSF
jgi:cytochrome bd ubiquinol oxidase subunit II